MLIWSFHAEKVERLASFRFLGGFVHALDIVTTDPVILPLACAYI